MVAEDVKIDIPGPREDVVSTAVSFLINPKIKQATVAQRESFLKSKGLTEEEIRLAFERSAVALRTAVVPQIVTPPLPIVTPFQRFKDILHTVSLLIGAAYGIYYFFKRVVIPFLFGKPKKPDGLEGKIADLNVAVNSNLGDLRDDLKKFQTELDRVALAQNDQLVAVRNLGDIKAELATVKGILLSRQQFPTVNLTGSTSIPAWQMSSCPDNGDRSSEANNNSNGGGSSGSDSSLEMIKEVEAAEAEA